MTKLNSLFDSIILHWCYFSAQHLKKKNFVDELRKAVNPQNNKTVLMEGAVTACVRMCKAFTYVKSTESSNVLLTLVKSVVLDLKVCLKLIDILVPGLSFSTILRFLANK